MILKFLSLYRRLENYNFEGILKLKRERGHWKGVILKQEFENTLPTMKVGIKIQNIQNQFFTVFTCENSAEVFLENLKIQF